MQQKTDGRVVRFLTKHQAAEEPGLEQWFLVAIGDDEKAKDAVSKATKATNEVIEIIGNIPASSLASWGLTDGEVRLILPGEPVTG
jgi:hypothetical protein